MINTISSNYPCLEDLFMVPEVFESLKFGCMVDLEANPLEIHCRRKQNFHQIVLNLKHGLSSYVLNTMFDSFVPVAWYH